MSLAADALTVDFAGRRILDAICIAAPPGSMTLVIGPNGAGKSTLLRAMAGLVPVTSGRVTLAGDDVAAMPGGARGQAIAYLPQSRLVHWPLRVREVVALGRLPHRHAPSGDSSADAAAIDQAIATLGLGPLVDRTVDQLSGGELARVLLARALAQQARVLIADEPTASLDPAHQLAVFDELQRLARGGAIVIAALHDLSLAARFADQVAVIASGCCRAVGPPAEVLTAELLTAVFGARMSVGEVGGMPAIVAGSRLAPKALTQP
jgi:iron complex transport system ATP-binding protein